MTDTPAVTADRAASAPPRAAPSIYPAWSSKSPLGNGLHDWWSAIQATGKARQAFIQQGFPMGNGLLAELRHASTLQQLLVTPACQRVIRWLEINYLKPGNIAAVIDWREEQQYALATAIGLLMHINHDIKPANQSDLAVLLTDNQGTTQNMAQNAKPDASVKESGKAITNGGLMSAGDVPPVSEARYRRLLVASDYHDLFNQFLGIMKIMKGDAVVPELINSIGNWFHPHNPAAKAWAFHYDWS